MDSSAFSSVFWGSSMCGFTGVIMVVVLIFYIAMIAVSIAGVVIWVLALIDIIRRGDKEFPSKGENQKLIWILVIVLAGYIGAIVYYFMVYKKMGAARGS